MLPHRTCLGIAAAAALGGALLAPAWERLEQAPVPSSIGQQHQHAAPQQLEALEPETEDEDYASPARFVVALRPRHVVVALLPRGAGCSGGRCLPVLRSAPKTDPPR